MSTTPQTTPPPTTPPTTQGPPLTVLVTGATGQVGRHLIRFLLADGHRVRALTRHPLTAGLPAEVELCAGDPSRPETLSAAAQGADAAFLLWMGFDSTGADAAVAALTAEVDHLVYLSAAELQRGRQGAKPGVWADVEAAVEASGTSWTFLRAGGFAGNTLGWSTAVRAGEPVSMPYPEAVRTSVHEADIAEVAWHALVDPVHRGRAYEITGPEQLTQRQEAEAIGAVIGHPVQVHQQTPEEARQQLAALADADYAEAALGYWATLQADPERVSGDVEQVTGHPARTFASWASDHRREFLPLDVAGVAADYVDAFRRGDLGAARALLAPEVLRVAPLEAGGTGGEIRGLTAITENALAQNEGIELLAVDVSDPLLAADRFGVRFSFDEQVLATGRRQRTTKLSLCTVETGRIVREEVFFLTPPTAAQHPQG